MTTTLAARMARASMRPLLMRPEAVQNLLTQIEAADATAVRSVPRLNAWHRARHALARTPRPAAFDDDEITAPAPLPPGGYAYAPTWMGEPDEELEWGMSLKDGIAVLRVDTAIDANGEEWCGTWFHGYDTIAAALNTAFEDPRVEGILLSMDSPGGVVDTGLDTVAEILRQNREAAGGKPVFVHADMAASAAYWIAAQADQILAPRQGLVGSIGAVIIHAENAGQLEKQGVTVTPITFGARKVDSNNFQPLSAEGRAKLQTMIDQCGRDFVDAVMTGRPSFTEDALLATEADIYTAQHDDPAHSGLARGFVDQLIVTDGEAAEAVSFQILRDHITGKAASGPALSPAATASSASLKRTTHMNKHARRRSARNTALAALANPRLSAAQAFSVARTARRSAGVSDEELDAEEDPNATEEELSEEEKQALEDKEANEENLSEDEKLEREEAANEEEMSEEEKQALEDEQACATEDETVEGDEKQPSAKTVLAIMDLPDAKDRQALARQLAGTPGMTTKSAKSILAAAPKASVRKPSDANLSAGGGRGGKGGSDVEAAAARHVALLER